MPTYPLTFPSIHPGKVQMSKRFVQAKAVSPFTLEAQIYDWQASQWFGTIIMQPMDADQAAIFGAFLNDLNGMVGTFEFNLTPWCKGADPGTKTFRLASPVHPWDSTKGVIFDFQLDVEEDV